jgi:serine/threonine protein kinase
MKRKGYRFVRPLDIDVGYNRAVAKSEWVAEQLTERFGLTDVEPIRVYYSNRSQKWKKKWLYRTDLYFQGFLKGEKFFLKANGITKRYESGYHCLLQCFQRNDRNFPEPLFYYEREGFRCIATEWLEGTMLGEICAANLLSASEKKNILLQMKDIAQTLYDAGIHHRDISNLLLTPQGLVKCIDFEMAVRVNNENYKERVAVGKNHGVARRLFGAPRPDSQNDALVLLQTLQAIGVEKEYEETYQRVKTFLEKLVEWNTVGNNRFFPIGSHRYLRKFFRVLLSVSERVFPTGIWKTTLQHWLLKKVSYYDTVTSDSR